VIVMFDSPDVAGESNVYTTLAHVPVHKDRAAMTMSTLHTITTHKKYRELLAEWAADNTDDSEQVKSASSMPDAVVLVAFRTRPPIDGEVELFDAPLDDEETDDEEQANDAGDHDPRAKKQPPAPRPVPKIPAQRPPEEFMCGITARPGRMVVHVPNMTVSVAD
jgi:hypothetical protein